MTASATRRKKLADRVAAVEQDTPEEHAIAKAMLVVEEAKIGVVETRLGDIADDIRAEYGKGIESQFAIGRLLIEARDLHPSDKLFGQWFGRQSFPFGTSPAYYLRIGAEREDEVRALLASNETSSDWGVTSAVKFMTAKSHVERTGEAEPITDTTPVDPAYDAIRTARRLLVDEGGFEAMHVDDMTKVALAVKDIVAAYNAEKTKRGI
jgi:hypothetical protein